MEEELEKVRKRIDKRLEQHDLIDGENVPINDALDHLQRIEGFPSNNVSKTDMKSLPMPIRALGYLLFGLMGLGVLVAIVMSIVK